jgi:hypothetical protein
MIINIYVYNHKLNQYYLMFVHIKYFYYLLIIILFIMILCNILMINYIFSYLHKLHQYC